MRGVTDLQRATQVEGGGAAVTQVDIDGAQRVQQIRRLQTCSTKREGEQVQERLTTISDYCDSLALTKHTTHYTYSPKTIEVSIWLAAIDFSIRTICSVSVSVSPRTPLVSE